MGRPPLKGTTMNVLLPEGVAERIDALVGNRRRAKFIREATVAELERREAEQAAAAGTPPPAETATNSEPNGTGESD